MYRQYQQSKQYVIDVKQGNKAEDESWSRLETRYGKLNKTDRYCYFDYENDNYIIELKSRNCNHNDYPTAMMNVPKIEKWKKYDSHRKFVSAFLYKDGLYIWEYDEDQIESVGQTGRNDRGCIEKYDVIYFKHQHFIFIPHPASPPNFDL